MGKPLYIDHQATTPVETAVLEAMKPFGQKVLEIRILADTLLAGTQTLKYKNQNSTLAT